MSQCRQQMVGEPDPAYEWCVQQHMRIDELTRDNADLRARLENAEKDRDTKAAAVRVMGVELYWYAACADDVHTCNTDLIPCNACERIRRLNAATRETQNNPTAAAAVKEASGG